MNKFLLLMVMLVSSTALAQSNCKVYMKQGCARQVIDHTGAIQMVPQVVTPASTPIVGTNDILDMVAVIPTAAAGQAGILAATPIPGKFHIICNQGANAERVKAGAATTVNGTAAGSYVVLATKQCGLFVNVDGTDTMAGLLTVPTPAGP